MIEKPTPRKGSTIATATPLPTSAFLLPQKFGTYMLLEYLDAGGMAEVFRAETDIGKLVALKILKTELSCDHEVKARFLEEAQVAAQFNHPNIVAVFHQGEAHGRPFIEMECLQGASLERLVADPAGLTNVRDQLQIAVQVAYALACVHAHGIKHRDVKPGNVYVCDSGVAKLIDFGIAKKAQSQIHTAVGFAVGTPFYMAPEQIRGEAISERTDIYAFGIVLFEMVTKTRGVTGESIFEVSQRVLNEPLDVGRASTKGVPPAVIRLIERCTAKDPADRPPSFREVRDDLQGIIHSLDDLERAAETPAAVIKAPRGPKRLAVILTACCLLLLLSVIFFAVRRSERGQPGNPPSRRVADEPVSAPPPQVIDSPSGEMRLVAAGPFRFGQAGEKKSLPDFYVDRYEVTRAAYNEYAKSKGQAIKPGLAALPVTHVNAEEARSFCEWAGKRLPNAEEWEKAARGPDGFPYPWGNAKDKTFANVLGKEARPVGSYPNGASVYGIEDMIGNVWEFVDAPHTPSAEERNHIKTEAGMPWIKVYGGAFQGPLSEAWDPAGVPVDHRTNNLGFRCAADPRR